MSDKAMEILADSIREMYPDDSGRRHVLKNLDEGTLDLVSARAAIAAINAALRTAPVGWSFDKRPDGSIVVTADGYGVAHVRLDDDDSIAAALLHLLADDMLDAAKEEE